MNDIIDQISDRIFVLDEEEDEDLLRKLLIVKLETYCRIALALAMDEVLRPDNHLLIADRDRLEKKRKDIVNYFRFGSTPPTLGKQLGLAEGLLSVFPPHDCPKHIRWLRQLIEQISATLQLRNVDAHQPPLVSSVSAMLEKLAALEANKLGNPYLDENSVCILVLQSPKPDKREYRAMTMDRHKERRKVFISAEELLRLAPGDDLEQARKGPNAALNAEIATSKYALYLHVTFPDGSTRLHLLSPVLSSFGDHEYGIFYSRKNSVFKTSQYILLNPSRKQEQSIIWNEQEQLLVARSEQLRSIEWPGPLFEDKDGDNPNHSTKIKYYGDGVQKEYFLNVRKDRMSYTYPELWRAVWGEESDPEHSSFFNVDVYNELTLEPLRRMFYSEAPSANPLQVCGQGGLGKTHTVINALFKHFIKAEVINDQRIMFRYIVFLTAKQTMFNTDRPGATYTAWENPDFSSCDEALWKILGIITDGRMQKESVESENEVYDTKWLVQQIHESLGFDPILLIIDDLDSVRSMDVTLEGEAKHYADREEQRKLVRALKTLTEISSDYRVVITTRRPLDESNMMLLKPLDPTTAIGFAEAYFKEVHAANLMPRQYEKLILEVGQGVPAFIMRTVYLLNRSISYSLEPRQLQKLKREIADFSLNTTSLDNVGKGLFAIMANLSNVLDRFPLGMIRLLMFDETYDAIDDALDDMEKWSMIEARGRTEQILLQNDSLILWSQIEHTVKLEERYQHVLVALRQDGDRLLRMHHLEPGALLAKVFEQIEPVFTGVEKRQFAQRVVQLLEKRDVFLQGMQNSPGQQTVVKTWVNRFLEQATQEEEADCVNTPDNSDRNESELAKLAAELQTMAWDTDKVAGLIEFLATQDFADPSVQAQFVAILEFLPRRLLEAVTTNQCTTDTGFDFADKLDAFCVKYQQYTGRNPSSEYLEPFVIW